MDDFYSCTRSFFVFLELTIFFHIMIFSLSALTYANQKIEYFERNFLPQLRKRMEKYVGRVKYVRYLWNDRGESRGI